LRLLEEHLASGLDINPPAVDAQLLADAREALGVKLKHALPVKANGDET
jgi:hypothetical protein